MNIRVSSLVQPDVSLIPIPDVLVTLRDDAVKIFLDHTSLGVEPVLDLGDGLLIRYDLR